jgi:hypothetical protein
MTTVLKLTTETKEWKLFNITEFMESLRMNQVFPNTSVQKTCVTKTKMCCFWEGYNKLIDNTKYGVEDQGKRNTSHALLTSDVAVCNTHVFMESIDIGKY